MEHDPALLAEVRGRKAKAAQDPDASLGSRLQRAAPLTEYAWKFRYPGDPEQATPEEAAVALSTAREVFAEIARRMPPEAAGRG